MAKQGNAAKKNSPAGTTVMACTCDSTYQDHTYGAGKRLHNRTSKGTCCTVCGGKKGA